MNDLKYVLVGIPPEDESVIDLLRVKIGAEIRYISVSNDLFMLQDHVNDLMKDED